MRMLQRNGSTVGGLLTFVAVLALGVGFFNFVAAEQPRTAQYVPPDRGGVIQPPREGPPLPGDILPPPVVVVGQTTDVHGLSIEQLVEHIAELKKQQAELQKKETTAIAELRKKLKDVNQKLEKMDVPPTPVDKNAGNELPLAK